MTHTVCPPSTIRPRSPKLHDTTIIWSAVPASLSIEADAALALFPPAVHLGGRCLPVDLLRRVRPTSLGSHPRNLRVDPVVAVYPAGFRGDAAGDPEGHIAGATGIGVGLPGATEIAGTLEHDQIVESGYPSMSRCRAASIVRSATSRAYSSLTGSLVGILFGLFLR